ncbi:X-prolyl-dipeptidyl aminopeptidase [Plantactinospora sp. BC1]|uniref:CocE/NonD family hydrolase n=1 Tax=Plantactinospora sp. BC1 TaxID=2108470 RepID=UPI000D15ECD2|nr:CocE/NonD family hydrolase [Plantactinospora sp. BC1]AVT31732.1 X-prolyl-dipeptidyl aminopeptidase [Plantactinospora sp. BC1]
MSRSFAAALAAGVLTAGGVLVGTAPAVAAPPGRRVENGATQPVFARDAAIQETVYVNSGMDSDGDGATDRIAVQVIRPEETEAGLQVATVMHASPYFGDGTAPRGDLIVPAHFTAWYDDYFVPRGYAVVEVDMQGTAGSDGCATIGGPEDVRSASAAIDWLNGRATASYSDGTPAVADWSTGAVGMIGVSYAGTLPIAVAETGIEGLETIVPIASISAWYDYARAQGIAYGGFGSRYPESLARYVSSPAHDAECDARYTALGNSADDATADMNAFWQQRDYRDGAASVDASVFLVHGQQDNNTKTTHFGRYWDAIAAQGVPRKLWLHDGGHVDPFGSDLVGRDTVGRWMDHWLYDIANGIMNEPQATIKRPGGTTSTYPSWPGTVTSTNYHLGGPGGGAAGTLLTAPGPAVSQSFTDSRGQLEYAMTSQPETAKPNRLVYLAPASTTARRLAGAGTVEVRFSATSTSTPLTAVLVHYTDGVPTRVVSRGAIDTKNRSSLTTGTPLTPGTAYTVTIRLEPKDYVFPVGSRIGLVLVANHGEYLTTDSLAAGVTVQLSPSRLTLPLTN